MPHWPWPQSELLKFLVVYGLGIRLGGYNGPVESQLRNQAGRNLVVEDSEAATNNRVAAGGGPGDADSRLEIGLAGDQKKLELPVGVQFQGRACVAP